ncbi:hypothetical protein RAS2_04140 [Phycisphaerae bacterium RAS2]|nr:hypothetical protein RAS2_04140 [Phycisphaerae bacterium RAS2]
MSPLQKAVMKRTKKLPFILRYATGAAFLIVTLGCAPKELVWTVLPCLNCFRPAQFTYPWRCPNTTVYSVSRIGENPLHRKPFRWFRDFFLLLAVIDRTERTTMLVQTIQNHSARALRDYGMLAGEFHVVCAMFCYPPQSPTYVLDSTRLLHVPVELFSVIDGQISRHWRFGCDVKYKMRRAESVSFWGYSDFVNDNDHRAALFDGDPGAEAVFKKYCDLCTLEFRLAHVEHVAAWVNDNRVTCASCGKTWDCELDINQMVRCPLCTTLQHKPAKLILGH